MNIMSNISCSCAGQTVSVCVIVDPHLGLYQMKASGWVFFPLTQRAINRSPISLLPVSHAPRVASVPSPHIPGKFFCHCTLYLPLPHSSSLLFSFLHCQSSGHPKPNPHSPSPCLNRWMISYILLHVPLLFSVPFNEFLLFFFLFYPLAFASRKTNRCVLLLDIPWSCHNVDCVSHVYIV